MCQLMWVARQRLHLKSYCRLGQCHHVSRVEGNLLAPLHAYTALRHSAWREGAQE